MRKRQGVGPAVFAVVQTLSQLMVRPPNELSARPFESFPTEPFPPNLDPPPMDP
jgi:hypothetical protein